MADSAQMSTGRILVIDDETAMLEACQETLSHHGYQVSVCDSADGGVEAVRRESFDVVLVDLRMPGKDGLEVLRELEGIDGSLFKIMVTGFPTISTAVEAVKEGAFDYLPKPFSPDQLLITVERALSQRRLAEENSMLRRTLKARPEFEGIVARSPAMERVMDLVERLAESDSSVVILGETGTGKELIARSLHANSPRSSAHFVPIDCGALPGQLLESELFGHERGAFTGAFTRKTGLLESAQGGTVFLDEIAALDIDLQAKLLRVLQERKLRRLGGQEVIDIDFRLISATNEDLEKAVGDGRFRRDLYYRIDVVTITLPPLRERAGDVTLLADHFARVLGQRLTKEVAGISKEAFELMERYPWPGNVRELQNAIEYAYNLTDSGTIDADALPARIREATTLAADGVTNDGTMTEARGRFERRFLADVLRRCSGNVSHAAIEAGLHRTTFQRLMRKHGVQSSDYRSHR